MRLPALLAAALLLAACDSPTEPEALRGEYAAITANGLALPADISFEDGSGTRNERVLRQGALYVSEDGTIHEVLFLASDRGPWHLMTEPAPDHFALTRGGAECEHWGVRMEWARVSP